ncbi:MULTISPECIES: calcium-translocating P-type ATPase, SERCA-type [Paraliobacillus]|uniref:calcium-translocating P-type ATPase, SERCA-type n=1 Tax=Paraliobacillus TaxID=200903 RepID=UPI002103C6C6|nr:MULTISPECIES: calcium-translocating P-type ATPase, SERCA-type [Paraliobacillus]
MNWYQLSEGEVLDKLAVNQKVGLTKEVVTERLKKTGPNQLDEKKKASLIFLFIKQFQDFMVFVLLAATLLSGLLGEYVDAIAIIVIVVINSFIGFFQEQKAEKSLTKLKELSAPVAHVLRDKEWMTIPSQQVVIGDIIKLTNGDRIVADIRICQGEGLEIEESALTGESAPVHKKVAKIATEELDYADQQNMAFMGTLVSKGTGVGVVVATGMQTVMGQIADLLVQTKAQPTPLERRLADLGKILIVIALILTAFVVFIGVWQGHPLYDMFLAGISLAVAAIPEGLPAIVTVALSLGVQRMIKKKAIVRKLSAVETLGSTTVICSDKTGTMTENRMTVRQIYTNQRLIEVTGEGHALTGAFQVEEKSVPDRLLRDVLLYGMVCNHAALAKKKKHWQVDGDPTEGALLIAAHKAHLSEDDRNDFKIIKEIPFDSDRKRMTVIVEDKQKRRFAITKGAPDVLLPRINYMMDDGERRPFTSKDKNRIEEKLDRMTEQALRTIAICVKPIKTDMSFDHTSIENNLTFVGLVGMMDPPRKEVKKAIKACKNAGIKTVMITGDHAKTAEAIAKQLDILPLGGQVLNGYELNHMSEMELADRVDNVYVFARVTPAHKLKIVQALQAKGHIVAMTGDGVNDAPAMKASDIGISMGKSGTDVAKEASALVLLDDNFATIEAAIEEGRNIYENIRKFVRYLLASNVGEILVMLFAIALGFPLPLIPVQILWVNLVTDGLPAMALGLDQAENNVMKTKPRPVKEGIFSRGLGVKILTRGLLIGVVTLIAFMTAYQNDPAHLTYARTIAFTTLVMAQLIHVFDCRSERSIFSRNPFQNIYLLGAVFSSVVLLMVVIYYPPLQVVFETVDLHLRDWIFILSLSAIPTVLFGFTKNTAKS